MPAQVKTSICYLLSTAVADDVYMGGAMVTDIYGLPLEFRYTEPVVATKLQRILYGDVLERYIQTDVILAHLIENLESKPSLFVPVNAEFLGAVEGASRTVVWLGETRNAPLAEIGAQQTIGPDEILLQLGTSGAPARLRFSEQSDANTAVKRAETVRVLLEAGKSMDLIEPMRRIEKAVKLLWEESADQSGRPQSAK